VILYWVKRNALFCLLALVFIATMTLGCSSAIPQYTVNEEPIPTIGYYLTDGAEMTLYYTTMDSAGKSNVNGSELDDWPIFYAAKIVIPPTLKRSDFSTIKRPDGTLQTTYKGWPLYYSDKDDEPSDTVGQGIGGVWFLAGPNIPIAARGS
jgi:predicted lipoprotein with Yx(FWY)xxD motif